MPKDKQFHGIDISRDVFDENFRCRVLLGVKTFFNSVSY
jgi:hypothetical protein